jgi:ribulose-phosphate 3-epimerase
VYELRIAPSILSADFARLADEMADVAPAVPMLHVDVMDGHYVPNITIGPPVVSSIRAATDRFLDCHLMITDPRTFHPEVEDDPAQLIDQLHEQGAEVGVALKPAHPLSMVEELLDRIDLLLIMSVEPGFGGQSFMPEVVPKIAEAHRWRQDHGARFRLEVDGGIKAATIGETVRAGADTLVAGSAVFNQPDRVATVRELLNAAEAARGQAA